MSFSLSWLDRNLFVLPLLFPPFFFQYFCDVVPKGKFLVIMYAVVCLILLKQRLLPLSTNRVFLGLVCFLGYICIQYFWIIDKDAYAQKLYFFLSHGLTYFVAGVILNSEKSIFSIAHRILFMLLFSRTVIVLAMFFGIFWSYKDILSGSRYQVFTHYIALGLIVYLPFLFDKKQRYVKIQILTMMIISLFMTGGTGGTAALLVTLSLWMAVWCLSCPDQFSIISKYATSIVLISALSLFIASIMGRTPYSLTTIAQKTSNVITYILHPERLSVSQQKEESVLERWKIIRCTIPVVKQHFLFGVGFGCWRQAVEQLTLSHTIYEYPHNIVLELISETGMVGLVLFASAVWFAFVPIGGLLNPRIFVAKVGLTYWLIIHCISGDLTDSWLYLFLGFASVDTFVNDNPSVKDRCDNPT